MRITVTGVPEVQADMVRLLERIDDMPGFVAEVLADEMRQVVHTQTGYLLSSIYSRSDEAGARAPYADAEAERGGSHDFPRLAMDNLDDERLADWLMEVLS